MAIERQHGARVFQSGEDPVIVRFVATSVIGLLAAVDPDDLPAGVAVNTPILINRASDATLLPAAVREELDTIYDQVTTQVVLVLIDEGEDAAALMTNAVGDATQKTGVHAWLKAASMGMPKPKLLCAPGLTTAAAADGIASVSVTTPGSGYTEEGTTATVAGETTGQGATLRPVIVNGAIDSIVVEKPGYGYDGTPTVTIDGDGTSAAATAAIGQVLNPVIAEAQGIAEQNRAQFYADGPDGTAAQAVTARQLIGSRRICFSDPRILKSIDGAPTPKSSSTLFAAVQSKMDRTNGPHWPASNQLVNGIQGTNRPVDTATEASYLNESGVNTIINRYGDGFRLWGPMTCAVGTVWEFVNVVRVADLVNESVEIAFGQFNDRPMTLANLDLMVMAGRAAMRGLENEGVILAGSSFELDREALEPEDGAQGIVKFAMRYEPPAPIYDIRVTAYRNILAYDLLFDSVTGQVTTGDLIQ